MSTSIRSSKSDQQGGLPCVSKRSKGSGQAAKWKKVKMPCLDWVGVMTRPDGEEYQWASDPMEKRSNRQSEGFSK